MNTIIKNYLPIVFILCVTLFLSTYKLSESPKTWMDEGIIVQVSKNLAEHGLHSLQIAPNEFVSAGIVSTGYTVTAPIAVSFKIFGVGLLQARSVMVLYIVLLISFVFYFLKRHWGGNVAFFGTLLVATFSPLYGQGKNVLGEVPGLALFFIFLYYLDKVNSDDKKKRDYILLGVFAGLVFATKSIYILILPSVVIVYIWHIYKKDIVWDRYYYRSIFTFLAFVCFWVWIQFGSDSFTHILSIYANPHSSSLIDVFRNTAYLFVSELQPIYFLLTFFIWSLAYIFKIMRNDSVKVSESISLVLSLLILIAFFRTPGYYRYFFIAQFISLVYLLPSIEYLFKNKHLSRYIILGICGIIAFHSYQTIFNSWVASYYNSHKTQEISLHTKNISQNKIVLLYQVPEFVVFMKGDYYQFIDIAPKIKVGESNKELVRKSFFDTIYINSEVYEKNMSLFDEYTKIDGFDSYFVLERIQ